MRCGNLGREPGNARVGKNSKNRFSGKGSRGEGEHKKSPGVKEDRDDNGSTRGEKFPAGGELFERQAGTQEPKVTYPED